MSRTYLITGATTQLGNHIINRLYAQSCKVRVLITNIMDNTAFLAGKCQIFYGDINDKESMSDFFDCPAQDDVYLIHCDYKFTPSEKFDDNIWYYNVIGTKNVLDMSAVYGVKKVVIACSALALPNGSLEDELSTESVNGLFRKTLSAAVQIARSKRDNGLDISIAYHTALLGPDENYSGIVTGYINRHVNGQPISFKGSFDFTDVRDVAGAIIAIINSDHVNEEYILSNQYIDIAEFVKLMNNYVSLRVVSSTIPSWLHKVGLPFNTLYTKIRTADNDYSYIQKLLNNSCRYSCEKARVQLGYQPRDLRESIQDTLNFLKAKY